MEGKPTCRELIGNRLPKTTEGGKGQRKRDMLFSRASKSFLAHAATESYSTPATSRTRDPSPQPKFAALLEGGTFAARGRPIMGFSSAPLPARSPPSSPDLRRCAPPGAPDNCPA